jgi:hypothetical protein
MQNLQWSLRGCRSGSQEIDLNTKLIASRIKSQQHRLKPVTTMRTQRLTSVPILKPVVKEAALVVYRAAAANRYRKMYARLSNHDWASI